MPRVDVQVRATDEDSGLFGRVTYSFVDDLGRSRFSIDGGGVISTAGPLDREDPASRDLLLTVRALDGGGSGPHKYIYIQCMYIYIYIYIIPLTLSMRCIIFNYLKVIFDKVQSGLSNDILTVFNHD